MSLSPLDDLAGALAHAQDERLADGRASRLVGMRAALLADPRVAAQSARPAWIARTFALAALVLLLVGAGLWLRERDRATLTFTVGDESLARVEALWIAAPDAPVEVEFSDGSRLVLSTGSRARVEASDGGRVVLESGGMTIRTSATAERRSLVVDAGPFEVVLAEASCDVTWDGTAQRLGVDVRDGRVHVTGPAGQAHEVVAGQRVDISPRDELAVAAGVASANAPREPAVVAVEPEQPSHAERTPARKHGAKTGTALPDWSTLARASKHREALAAAEAVGFGSLCDSLGPAALLQLADTARFAGESGRATTALEALRRRHPKSDEAAVAAYTLGRIAAGQRRPAEAAERFATYLRERPRGSLAREALGRKLEAEAAAGWEDRADATARRYLELHPNGPHADLAAARSR